MLAELDRVERHSPRLVPDPLVDTPLTPNYLFRRVCGESPSGSSFGAQGSKAQALLVFRSIQAGTAVYLCYLDESGTTGASTGDTSHFVLAGLSIPIWHWRDADREVSRVLRAYGLADVEFHTAWMLRKYLEQSRIPDFEQLAAADRRREVNRRRSNELSRLAGPANDIRRRRARKLHRNTEPYVHLTWKERRQAVLEVAETVSNWGFARLFAECVDKSHFDPVRSRRSVSEQAFEQVVSRFERFLQNVGGPGAQRNHGLLVHDNNETVARRHTRMMRSFHATGTLWTSVDCIIETPMFVDSKLTRMVQIADLCAYALRRYLENGETGLFRPIFERADRIGDVAVGVRHFSRPACDCAICLAHQP